MTAIIGHPRRMEKKNKAEVLAMEIKGDQAMAKYVRDSFSCKECTVFVPKTEETPRRGAPVVPYCHCGAAIEEHANAEKATDWKEDKCIQKFPTNAYGRIRFTSADIASSQRTKYLRLADDTPADATLDFMSRFWRLIEDDDGVERPQLIISVVGGGRMFKLAESVQKKLFNRELMRAVATTKGWLLTSGLDAGVAHAVGDSMREAQSFVWRDDFGKFKNRICCIGIVPWGGIFGGNRLINGDPQRTNDVSYSTFAASTQFRFKKRLPLNPYHTHFLMVDDGYRNRERGVADFRAKLERQIAQPVDSGGLGIPVVQILIDGAANALEIVARSVAEGVPVLVCEGTGRAADLLAQVCRSYGRLAKTPDEAERESKIKGFRYFLRERVISLLYADHLPIDANERYDRCVEDIMQICEKRNMITIFNAKRGSALDTAILASLMDRTQHTERSSQLSLALKWNRIDVAKAKIFGSAAASDAAPLELWPFFVEAVITDKPEFVRLFIEYGLDVKSSMTVIDLADIYQRTVQSNTLLFRLLHYDCMKLKQNPLSLADIYKIIKEATRGFDHPLYSTETQDPEFFASKFDEPFDELFLWAVLLNNEILAIRFWEYCEQPLVTALTGTLLCQFLASRAKSLTGTLKEQQLDLKNKLEALAISLAAKAFRLNTEQTMLLLHRRWNRWGNFTCMEIAAMAKDQAFLSSEPCQHAIWKTWTRGYEASGWAIAVSAFTIFPVLALIHFEDEGGQMAPSDIRGSVVSITKAVPSAPRRSANVSLVPEIVDGAVTSKQLEEEAHNQNSNGKRFWFGGSQESLNFLAPFHVGITAGSKYITFYRSPSVKYACHTLSYILYLMLYAYVILFSFRPHPTMPEMVLHLWTFTLFCEQVRLVVSYTSETFKDKVEDWWVHSSMAAWNRLDFLMLFIYLVALVLRIPSTTFKSARLLFSFNYITCLFRLFKIYFVNSYLGPKVVMLKRMAFDLAMFLLVLVIILLSYTVVSHALLFPYKEFYTGIFWNLLYHGVWVLFGEVQPEMERTADSACPAMAANETEPVTPCETHTLPPPILLAAYCFFGNILLINMLIATFTNVFEEVQRNSEHLWKYLMYFVVKEFNEKPTLPAPFIIIEHLYLIVNHCRRSKLFGGKASVDLVWGRNLTPTHYRFLSVFEKTMRSDLVEEKQHDDGKQVEKLLPEMHERIHRIYTLLKALKKDSAAAQRGVYKRKGAFIPAVSQFAKKLRRRIPAPQPMMFWDGRMAPDAHSEGEAEGGEFPMIDEDEEMPAADEYGDFFLEQDECDQEGDEILEHLS